MQKVHGFIIEYRDFNGNYKEIEVNDCPTKVDARCYMEDEINSLEAQFCEIIRAEYY